MPTMTRTRLTLGVALAAAALAPALGGCRGDRSDKPPRRFFPDMDKQPRWNPQEGSEFFPDGRTLRAPDERSVAYGRTTWAPGEFDADWAAAFDAERASMLDADPAFSRGLGPDGNPLAYAPVEVTREMITRGQERFNIYCAVCHGYAGDGKGMVGVRWSYPPANLTGAPYTDRNDPKGTDGHLFDVIRNGVWGADGANRMPGYRHAVSEPDAWAIVSYIRTLQKAQNATIDDLPPGERQRLEATRGTAPAQGGG